MKSKALKKVLLKTAKGIVKYAPIIIAVVAGVGTVETAVLAVKGKTKADELNGVDISETDLRREVIRAYAPAIVVGAVTIACIAGGTCVGWKRQRALTKTIIHQQGLVKAYKDAAIATAGAEGTKMMNRYMAEQTAADAPEPKDEEDELFYIEPTHEWMCGKLYDIMGGVQDCNNAFGRHGYLTVAQMHFAFALDVDDEEWTGFGWYLDNDWFNCNEDANLYMFVSDKKHLENDNLEYRSIYVESCQMRYDEASQIEFNEARSKEAGEMVFMQNDVLWNEPTFNASYLWAPQYIGY